MFSQLVFLKYECGWSWTARVIQLSSSANAKMWYIDILDAVYI